MKIKAIVLFFSTMALPILLFAQDPPPGFDGESPYVVTDVQVPIDNWVIVLVAATLVYGLFKAKSYKKNRVILK